MKNKIEQKLERSDKKGGFFIYNYLISIFPSV